MALFPLQRGVRLTPTGQQKLSTAVQQYYQGRNLRVNSQRIAHRADLPLDTTIGILYGQATTNHRTLKRFFRCFEVVLTRQDFQVMQPESESSPKKIPCAEPEPESTTACVGRDLLLQQLQRDLDGEVWVQGIVGVPGVGKATLGQQLCEHPLIQHGFPHIRKVDLSPMWVGMATIARQVLGEAIAKTQLETAGMEALIAAVVQKLQSQPMLLWLQNLPVAIATSDPFQQFLTALIASPTLCSRVLITTTTQVKFPLVPHLQVTELTDLSFEAIAQLYNRWGIPLDSDAQNRCLQTIHRTYHGHPLALKLIAGEIRSFPYFGNIPAYWQDHGYEYEITPQVTSSVSLSRPRQPDTVLWLHTLGDRVLQRLANHVPLAADLLELGAANLRPTPAHGWYFLLGELPTQQQIQTFDLLQDRLLIETVQTNNGLHYVVHPVLRRLITPLNIAPAKTEVA